MVNINVYRALFFSIKWFNLIFYRIYSFRIYNTSKIIAIVMTQIDWGVQFWKKSFYITEHNREKLHKFTHMHYFNCYKFHTQIFTYKKKKKTHDQIILLSTAKCLNHWSLFMNNLKNWHSFSIFYYHANHHEMQSYLNHITFENNISNEHIFIDK